MSVKVSDLGQPVPMTRLTPREWSRVLIGPTKGASSRHVSSLKRAQGQRVLPLLATFNLLGYTKKGPAVRGLFANFRVAMQDA